MSAALWHQEPRRVESKVGRWIQFVWDVEVREDGSTLQAVLHVSHAKAGINYSTYEHTYQDRISAGLRQQLHAPQEGYAVTSFTLFSGLGIARWDDGSRFSFKRLQSRASEALEALRVSADTYPQTAAYFLGEVEGAV